MYCRRSLGNVATTSSDAIDGEDGTPRVMDVETRLLTIQLLRVDDEYVLLNGHGDFVVDSAMQVVTRKPEMNRRFIVSLCEFVSSIEVKELFASRIYNMVPFLLRTNKKIFLVSTQGLDIKRYVIEKGRVALSV